MDIQAIVNKLVDGLHFFSTAAGTVVVGVVGLALVVGSVKFMKKDQRGTEEGKDMVKNSMLTLGVVALAWVVANAAYNFFVGLIG